MRYRALGIISVLVLAVMGWAVFQTAAQPEEPSFARLMPQGAVLFLEARDFSALLRDWGASNEKQTWLKSANYETFSRSRLFLRLQQAQTEFATAAGIPPNMAFLDQIAGRHTALGLYDIGKLELLYITRLPDASAMQSALWQKRSQFEPREVAGRQFFVRTEPQSGRVVAFAIADGYLVLGTREDLVVGALSLLAGQKLATLTDQSWFADAVKAGKEPGDLRLVIHLAEVTKTPQFRTYWVQQNITDMRQYESSISDLYRSPAEYKEDRVLLLKSEPATPPDDGRAVADLLRLVPAEAGLYRASSAPSVEASLALLEEKVLTPRLGPAPPEKVAPTVSLGEGTVGSESNLEVRIDAAPIATTADGKTDDLLKVLLAKANLRAVLELHRSNQGTDGVFVRLGSTVVMNADADWDEQAVRAAAQHLISPALTTGELGASWKTAGSAAQSYAELDGLAPVMIAVRGKYLVVSNDSGMIGAVLARMREPVSAQPAIYAAGFDHSHERQNFYHLTALVDRPGRNGDENPEMQPQFFSQNIASLSRVFGDVKSQTVVVRRTGAIETQAVRYEWSR